MIRLFLHKFLNVFYLSVYTCCGLVPLITLRIIIVHWEGIAAGILLSAVKAWFSCVIAGKLFISTSVILGLDCD